ncbi:helix-turn-helix domain-containing protein [Nocardia tengchongensis]|uniref:helix-turn-helix domain-containing protein n=1 Tax=Nocardia tengchongensis TaxID=2055889 RepID=UPI00364E26E1
MGACTGVAMGDPGDGSKQPSAAIADRLAREIKRRRIAAGSSQRVPATQIGYSRQYVSMTEWEDANLPSSELVTAIDTALGADGADRAQKPSEDRPCGGYRPVPLHHNRFSRVGQVGRLGSHCRLRMGSHTE